MIDAELREEMWATAKEKGFYQDNPIPAAYPNTNRDWYKQQALYICGIADEIFEAFHKWSKNYGPYYKDPNDAYVVGSDPEGWFFEFADAIIRLSNFMMHYSIPYNELSCSLPGSFQECILYILDKVHLRNWNSLMACLEAMITKYNGTVTFILRAKMDFNKKRPFLHGGNSKV